LLLGDGSAHVAVRNSENRFVIDQSDVGSVSLHMWHFTKTGYVCRYLNNPRRHCVLLHRQLLGAGPGDTCDHANGDRADNRRANLRLASLVENARNKHTARLQIGLKGVERTRSGRWRAVICAGAPDAQGHAKRLYLGVFGTAEEAAAAYDDAALQHFGPFAAINGAAPDLLSRRA
jgi:AP2 domain-containing protein